MDTCFVPQGTALGPLLFSLYINNIMDDTGFEIRLFVDGIQEHFNVDSIGKENCLKSSDESLIFGGITDFANAIII